MAYSVLTSLPPPLLVHRKETLVRALSRFPVCISRGELTILLVAENRPRK